MFRYPLTLAPLTRPLSVFALTGTLAACGAPATAGATDPIGADPSATVTLDLERHRGGVPKLPSATLAVPAGNELAFFYDAVGVQIYQCQEGDAGDGWVFTAPEATLYDSCGRVAGKHFAGPTWEAFLVLELLDGLAGHELAEAFGGRLPVGAVAAIGVGLLDVLEAAHARGIIHRDVKPANLFVLAGGPVKVLDFGIARVREMARSGDVSASATLLGTPSFMAPEQAKGEGAAVDVRADVWSAGATLFSLLCGETVHEASSQQQAWYKAATEPARSLASVAPRLPGGMVAVVDRALAFHAADRWASARAMRDALADLHRSLFTEPAAGREALADLVTEARSRRDALAERARRMPATMTATPVPAPAPAPAHTPAPAPAPAHAPAPAQPPPPLPGSDPSSSPASIGATTRSERAAARPAFPGWPAWSAGALLAVSAGLYAAFSPLSPAAEAPATRATAALPPVPPLVAAEELPLPPSPRTAALAGRGAPSHPAPRPLLAEETPRSCADARAAGISSDGVLRIDPDGSGPVRPFDVHCAGMADGTRGAAPREYLTLEHGAASGEPAANATTRVWGDGRCPCPDLVRRFARLRLHPEDMTIDPTDGAFATDDRSTACERAHRTQCGEQLDLAWGTPESCRSNGDPAGRATIDLRGTPFALAPGVRFVPAGFQAAGHAEISADRKTATLVGGGRCGGMVPADPRIAVVQDR